MVKLSLGIVLCSVALVCSAQAFSRKAPEPAAAAPAAGASTAAAAEAQVWITRPDGAQSCSAGSGQSLDEGAAELRKSKVRVLDSRKGNDGKMHMQMCGAPAGSTNAFLIPEEDLSRAVALGFVQSK
jgi:hypothetical protein